MSYAELSDEERIILSAECVGRGVPIPREIKDALGPDLISIIENPGAKHDTKSNAKARHGRHPPGPS